MTAHLSQKPSLSSWRCSAARGPHDAHPGASPPLVLAGVPGLVDVPFHCLCDFDGTLAMCPAQAPPAATNSCQPLCNDLLHFRWLSRHPRAARHRKTLFGRVGLLFLFLFPSDFKIAPFFFVFFSWSGLDNRFSGACGVFESFKSVCRSFDLQKKTKSNKKSN